MRGRQRAGGAIAIVSVLAGNATLTACRPEMVPVVADGPSPGGGTAAAPSDPSFEVVARTSGVRDPLPVAGSGVAYADLEPALGKAVLQAVRPRHDHTLTIELISADASYSGSRLALSLVARATLRKREGNAFVAQTQAICRESGAVVPSKGAPLVWSCMTRLGRDLGGWLDGVSP